jgi:hypothetical protein
MPSATCGWCNLVVNMKMRCSTVAAPLGHEEGEVDTNAVMMGVYCCDNCSRFSIAYSHRLIDLFAWDSGSGPNYEYDDAACWIPLGSQNKPYKHVPAPIADSAAEAYRCFAAHAYRGAVGLARAVMQATAKDNGIHKPSLYQDIEQLHADGHIRTKIKEAAHAIRDSGNEVLHADLTDVPISHAEAEIILKLMDLVLEDVYQVDGGIAELNSLRVARLNDGGT